MISRVSLTILPLIILLMATLLNVSALTSSSAGFNVTNQTVNQQTEGLTTSPIDFTVLTIVAILLGSFVAIAIALGIHVLGSGISGQSTSIVFICGISLGVWTMLSTLSISLFTAIPYFGLPIYFALSIMFIIGVASLTTSGGD